MPPQPGLEPSAELPDFRAVGELAGIVGANPRRLADAIALIRADRGTIAAVVRRAAEAVAAAGADLLAIAQRYLHKALGALTGLAQPIGVFSVPGALAGLAVEALTEVKVRLERLEADLAPLAQRLSRVAGNDAADAALRPAASAHAATDSLRALEAGAPATPVAFEAASAQEQVPAPGPADPPPGEGSAAGQAAVAAAKSQLGAPYQWGGTGPGGFDCSGLTQWAYAQAGVELPRMAHQQAIGTQVTFEQLQPGDLAVWDGHVAMYAGDGMYIEAGDPVQLNPVRTSNIGMPFRGFWRPTG
ncbi:NlpC/P60 family protein [Corynebacterium liangguodongii]|uniref:NlpC/P60 family protein n=1 Tax=Corynebacterium liangguodongii TaxID=2079535 RepID=A0A2S0WGV8_9CORY|nr:NlpC/P60 family protein [Corynebacterium liangguodongii]PWC00682.1 NlpC/P60 family protein [Corynebacterium liangguodongii]